MYRFHYFIWLTNRFTFHSDGRILKVAAAAPSEQRQGYGYGYLRWLRVRQRLPHAVYSACQNLRRRGRVSLGLPLLLLTSEGAHQGVSGTKTVFAPKLHR